MKPLFRFAPDFALVLSAFAMLVPALRAQKLTLPPENTAPAPLEARRKDLSDLIRDYWDAYLKHNPEFASVIGDTRFNAQVTDYSVDATNDWLAQEQRFLMRLVAIDPTGFTDDETRSQQMLAQRFEDDQKAADANPWQMQVTPAGGIYSLYPALAGTLSFTTEQDYDDWITRLRALPHAFSQVTENLEIGMDDHNVPPKPVVEQALAQVKILAHQKPEDSPLGAPLKKFPASISQTSEQDIHQEMLDAIGKDVLPAYLRFERFLQVSYLPAAQSSAPNASAPQGAQDLGTRNFQLLTKTLELRARAEKALGPKFDLKRFHDAVLAFGYMPLDAFEQHMNDWIKASGH